MEKNKDFKFKVNVSIDTYKDKTEARYCISSKKLANSIGKEKMSFIEQDITPSELITYATQGHSFANLFNLRHDKKYQYTWRGYHTYTYAYYQKGKNKGGLKLNFKTNQYYFGQQALFVDIDYTKFEDIYDYISTLTHTPTVMYTSFSDSKLKGGVVSRRFRLVYVFDKILNGDEVAKISNILYASIITDTNEDIEDKCGLIGAQYMNGTNGGETFCSNLIYSVTDFQINEVVETITPIQESPVEVTKTTVELNQKFVIDMTRLSYDEFMHYNSWKYHYYYRTERQDWINNTYQFTDENYISLFYNVNTVMDGEKRRKTLFERMCLRRVIDPEATPDTILFNAYVDRERYFNNDDEVITVDCLVRNVKNAFKLTLDEIKERYACPIHHSQTHRPEFIVKNVAGFTKNQVIGNVRRQLKDEEIGCMYDLNLTLKENLENINSNGLKISKSRLYQWVKDNGLETKKNTFKKDSIRDLVDNTKSIRENVKILTEMGYKTNYRQVREVVLSK